MSKETWTDPLDGAATAYRVDMTVLRGFNKDGSTKVVVYEPKGHAWHKITSTSETSARARPLSIWLIGGPDPDCHDDYTLNVQAFCSWTTSKFNPHCSSPDPNYRASPSQYWITSLPSVTISQTQETVTLSAAGLRLKDLPGRLFEGHVMLKATDGSPASLEVRESCRCGQYVRYDFNASQPAAGFFDALGTSNKKPDTAVAGPAEDPATRGSSPSSLVQFSAATTVVDESFDADA